VDTTAHLWLIVPLLGFALAFVYGAVAQRTGFCAMGAVSDVVNMNDWGRMRMWLLAIAVAILGANLLRLLGLVDLGKSMYTAERFTVVSYLVGGFLFGVGMTLASGCGSRNLVRLGGGNLKSLVVLLFLALSAYMTMKGLLAVPRTRVLDSLAIHFEGGQDLTTLLQRATGIGHRALNWLTAGGIGLALLAFVLKDPAFRGNRDYWIGGLVVGLVIVGGWYVTGHVGHVAEDPETLEEMFAATNTRRPESFSYVGPVAYSLELLLLWTDKSLKVTFGIAIVAGLFAGAFAYRSGGAPSAGKALRPRPTCATMSQAESSWASAVSRRWAARSARASPASRLWRSVPSSHWARSSLAAW
jgi:uncharacterized membrane protein YedE/YeeE